MPAYKLADSLHLSSVFGLILLLGSVRPCGLLAAGGGRLLLLAVLAGFCTGPGTAAESRRPDTDHREKPIVREINAGYLLDYSFKSPRLCCSSKDECHLSGWQIDKSGGHFEFSPTGHYPEDFAFHIDWFNRVDTNPVDAITIAHQVARREAGMITLEFRFKLTVVVDGISWQPSDPQEATFCLTTTNGNLCHATQ